MNLLSKEKSPYLLQHAANPVWWHPWGPEALSRAKSQGKPIFLSIGYSTCYWCHVMERDSFEVEEVADVLNRDFIAIKVDREERPDIDSIYMDAVVGLSGHGGWPMSVFLTPSGEPFWGGTFFYREQFLTVLAGISKAWKEKRQEVLQAASQISQSLKSESAGLGEKLGILEASAESILVKPEEFQALSVLVQESLAKAFDPQYGGFGRAPKFPHSDSLRLLMRLVSSGFVGGQMKVGNLGAREIVDTTLKSMAGGGIYDHLGGGFARYSTDREWKVPHFEKMLYDNALLLMAYLDAYQLTGDEIYRAVVAEIAQYVIASLESPQGGYFSAEDAGEVGKEGEYYVWTREELEEPLGERFAKLAEIFELPEGGNFENGKIVLTVKDLHKRFAENGAAFERKILFEKRSLRQKPDRDEKIICAWNGLMISAMARAGATLDRNDFLDSALRAFQFLLANAWDGKRLARHVTSGSAQGVGFLEDYVFLIEACLNLAQATLDSKYFSIAEELQRVQDATFWDSLEGGYYFAPASSDLLLRKKEFLDNAVPAGNATALENLLRLNAVESSSERLQKISSLTELLLKVAKEFPFSSSRALISLYVAEAGSPVVTFARGEGFGLPQEQNSSTAEGDQGLAMLDFLKKEFLPKIFYTSPHGTGLLQDNFQGAGNGPSRAILCHNQVCSRPVSTLEELKSLVINFK